MTSVLGKDANGISITIDKAERREGLYIIGSSGTGKSTLLTSLIQQDIRDNIGVCVADPHGDLIQRTIELMPPEKYKDVILLDVANPLYVFGLNIFHCENPQDLFAVENVISGVMHILDKVYNISNLTPQMNQYFLNITQTLLYNAPLSILDVPRLFSDKKFRLKLAANVPNTQVRWFWNDFFENRAKFRRDDEMSAVSNKLDDFFRPALKTIFGQEITTINMREIMDDPAGKILLVKMNARWESITKILGSVIVSQILDAAYSRSDIPIKKRRQFHLYADEFQWFASQDFSTLFSEARKYGIGLTIAHQTLEQVDPHIIATCKQAKTIISFRVSGENAESLSTQFDTTPPEPKMEEYLRKKQVPVTDVVGHLLRNGHKDPIVNQFRHETLSHIGPNGNWKSNSDICNYALYTAMIGDKPSAETILSFVKYVAAFHKLPTFFAGIFNMPPAEFLQYFETGDMHIVTAHMQRALEDIAISQITVELRKIEGLLYEIQIDTFVANSKNTKYPQYQNFTGRLLKREYIVPALKEKYTHKLSTTIDGLPDLTWFYIDVEEIEWEEDHGVGKITDGSVAPYSAWKVRKGQEGGFFDYERLRDAVSQMIATQEPQFTALVQQIKYVFQALAQTPILGDSGEEEVIYRPGPQQTHADRQAEIANMLTRLPNMHAYVRVAGQEHTLTIEQINRGMNRQALSDVIADITELNVGDGYIRSRKEVEAEIEARQHPDDPPPPPSPDGSPAEPPEKPDNGSASRASRPSTPLPTPRKRKIGS